ARRFEELAGLEAADVGAVALPHLEDACERQCAHCLAQGVAGEAELGGEVSLARQPRPWAPFSGGDQLADRLDCLVGDTGATAPALPVSLGHFADPSYVSSAEVGSKRPMSPSLTKIMPQHLTNILPLL